MNRSLALPRKNIVDVMFSSNEVAIKARDKEVRSWKITPEPYQSLQVLQLGLESTSHEVNGLGLIHLLPNFTVFRTKASHTFLTSSSSPDRRF